MKSIIDSKSSVIVINSNSPQNNLLFIIFQNSIKDDLRRLFEARLTTTWAVHTKGNFELDLSWWRVNMTKDGSFGVSERGIGVDWNIVYKK